MSNRKEWLRTWLEEWANWYMMSSGWNSATPEQRLRTVQTWGEGEPPENKLPRGVVPPGYLNRLIAAMQRVSEQGGRATYELAVVRAYYCLGSGAKGEAAVREAMKVSGPTVRRHKKAGERKIEEALREAKQVDREQKLA